MALEQGFTADWADIRALFDRIHAQRRRWGFDSTDITTSQITEKYGSQNTEIKAELVTSMKQLLQAMTTNQFLKTPADATTVPDAVKGDLIEASPIFPNLDTVITKVEDTCGFFATFNQVFGAKNTSFDGNFGSRNNTVNSSVDSSVDHFGSGFTGGFRSATGTFNSSVNNSVNSFKASSSNSTFHTEFFSFQFNSCSGNHNAVFTSFGGTCKFSSGFATFYRSNKTCGCVIVCDTNFASYKASGTWFNAVNNSFDSWKNTTTNANVQQTSDTFFSGFCSSVTSGFSNYSPASGSFCNPFGFRFSALHGSFCSSVFSSFGTRNTTVFAEFRTTGFSAFNVGGFCSAFNAAPFFGGL